MVAVAKPGFAHTQSDFETSSVMPVTARQNFFV